MIDCPKCGAHVDGLVCAACGERGPDAPPLERRAVAAGGSRWVCGDCGEPAVFGDGARYWCRAHQPHRMGPAEAPPGGFQAIRDILTRAAPSRS